MRINHLTERQQHTAKNIRDAFCYLLGELEFEQISISMICRQAGVSRNTFYRFYKGKEDVLCAVLAQKTRETVAIYEEIVSCGQNEKNQQLRLAYLSFFSYWYACKELLLLLEIDGLYRLFWEVYIANYPNITTDQVIDENAEQDTFGYYYLGWLSAGLLSVLHLWQRHRFQETPEEMADTMMRIQASQDMRGDLR